MGFAFRECEFVDYYIIGGLSYYNGWSWPNSILFDCAMFLIIRLHYLNPIKAWLVTFLLAIFVVGVFNFGSAEMK